MISEIRGNELIINTVCPEELDLPVRRGTITEF